MSDNAWVVRPSVPDDEPCLAHLWIRSLMKVASMRARFGSSDDGVAHVCRDADEQLTHLHCDACDRRITHGGRALYWSVVQPVVTALLRSPHVRTLVACAVDRVHHDADEGPAIILGFSSLAVSDSARAMLWLGVKASVLAEADLAKPLIDDLLPDVSVHDARISALAMFPDVGRAGLSPAWSIDDRRFHHLLDVSYMRLHPSSLMDDASRFILDPEREVWRPREEKAA